MNQTIRQIEAQLDEPKPDTDGADTLAREMGGLINAMWNAEESEW